MLKLGFVPIPRPQYLFIGKSGDSSWYFVQDSQQVAPPQQALCGYVKTLSLQFKERRGKPKQKLNIGVDCEEEKFILESGVETIFSRGFIQGLLSLDSDRLNHPLTIAVERFSIREGEAVGDDAIACKLYQGSSVVKFDWDNSLSVEAGVKAIANRFPQLDVRIEGKTVKSTTTRHQHQATATNGNKANHSTSEQKERVELERILGQWLNDHRWNKHKFQEKIQELFGKSSLNLLSNQEIRQLINILSQLKSVNTEF
ncbi:MAG: hypothetical protein AAFO04_27045 [Cyanobacteria bacterium J06592_8]